MSDRFDLLAQQLFEKKLDDCSLDELQHLSNQHPYFAPAQYILLKKLQRENAPGYSEQLQKAILFYHNPLEFDLFINQAKYETPFSFEEETEVAVEQLPVKTHEEEIEEEAVIERPEEHLALPAEADVSESEGEIEEATPPHAAQATIAAPGVEQQEEEKVKEPELNLKDALKPMETVAGNENDLVFEPYHTVDYFASQGIKLSKEEATTDKFGKQLKSFTEWLKTMKRLPAVEQEKKLDPVSEQKVEHMAAHSVEATTILTEAMAEVWAKQGNTEKAIEIYNKLSLHDPSKRAYFAAKVESLKS